ncbi:ANTAR domain-containing protein [Streptomyces sp. NPDC046939]|uniref:ANTAR domain-containing protein n=1 Tax=Streptomyces sp. NPDC046939 TaxID=3155376 RepID=UPI0033E86032
MEQYARAAALQAWAARKQRAAVEMRLRAISMRVSAQAARTAPPLRCSPRPSPNGADTPDSALAHAAVVTEQAKGILAARFGCTPEQALFLLREHSHRTNQSCADLARQVVQHRGLVP